jgi:hypothetical protein
MGFTINYSATRTKIARSVSIRAARSRRTVWALLRTIGGALVHPIRQSGAGPTLREKASDLVATLPAARRAFKSQHVELAD